MALRKDCTNPRAEWCWNNVRFEGEPEEVLNPKKKVWEKISPDLVTDASKLPPPLPLAISDKPLHQRTLIALERHMLCAATH
jgi:hypothetical protein